jgi:hypothetical protein
MTPGLDRRDVLLTNTSVLGIDFLFVHDDTQTVIDVHFIAPPSAAQQGALTPDKLSIVATTGDAPPVPITGISFPTVAGKVVMQITTAVPGTFTRYTFTISNPQVGAPIVDPYLASVVFSFKAGCHSSLAMTSPRRARRPLRSISPSIIRPAISGVSALRCSISRRSAIRAGWIVSRPTRPSCSPK